MTRQFRSKFFANAKAALGYGLAMMAIFVASTVVVGASLQMMSGPISAAYLGAASRDSLAANQLANAGLKAVTADLQTKYDAGTAITTGYSYSSASAPSSVTMPTDPSAPTTLDKSVGSYTAGVTSVKGNQVMISVTATVGIGSYTLKKLVILSHNARNPLDNLSGLTLNVAYGLRKLTSSYAGSAIRVRRSSDNTEQDIGFTADGLLDVASLNTFLAGSGGTGGISTKPLDDVPSASAAFSLRKLRTAYAGSAIRVRRSSDNTEQDIGFTSSGDLDTTTLLSFVGSSDGFVSKWYDQSGNARDAVQATVGNQPRIALAGVMETYNGRPSVHYIVGSSTYLTIASCPLNGADGTFVGAIQSNTQSWSRVFDFNIVANKNLFFATLGNLRVNTGSGETGLSSFTVSAFGFYSFVRSGGTAYSYKNGSLLTSSSMNALNGLTFTNNYLGKSAYSGDAYYDGYQSELLFYASALSSANRQILEQSAELYYQPQNVDFSDVTAYANDKPLDDVGSAANAFGLRKLRTAYAGSAIQVRRSSDNTTQDIGFTVSGTLDTGALLTFVGNNDGFVTTWYDQSGNGQNATQATTAYQPAIVLSGQVTKVNNIPAIKFDGTNDRLDFTRSIGDDFSILACYSAIAGVGSYGGNWYAHAGIVDMDVNGVVNDFGTTLDATGSVYFGVGSNDTTIISTLTAADDRGMHRYTATREKASGVFALYVDQQQSVSGGNTNYNTLNAGSNIRLGAIQSASSTYFLNGYINEVLTYGSVLSSTNRRTLEYNQMIYNNTMTPTISTGYITKWYDQSGHGYDMTQSIPSSQPAYLWNNKSNVPMIKFDGLRTVMNTVNTLNITGTQLTAFAVGLVPNSKNLSGRLFTSQNNGVTADTATNSCALLFYTPGTNLAGYRNTVVLGLKALTLNQIFQSTSYLDGTNHTLRLNGVAGTSVATSGTFGINQLFVGANLYPGVAHYWLGNVSELILYSGNPTTAQMQALENNERSFFKTP